MDDLRMGRLRSASAFLLSGFTKEALERLYITQTSKKYEILGYYLVVEIQLGGSGTDCLHGGFPCQEFQKE